jgi:hypothetical protein
LAGLQDRPDEIYPLLNPANRLSRSVLLFISCQFASSIQKTDEDCYILYIKMLYKSIF